MLSGVGRQCVKLTPNYLKHEGCNVLQGPLPWVRPPVQCGFLDWFDLNNPGSSPLGALTRVQLFPVVTYLGSVREGGVFGFYISVVKQTHSAWWEGGHKHC